MLRKRFVIPALLLAMIMVAGTVAAAEKIVNGIDANFPPFAYVDKTGTPSGFDVEVMGLIAAGMGMDVTHQPTEWDGIITSLLTKKIDIIASGMSITDKREKMVNFTIPYWKIENVMVTKKGSSLTLDQLLKGGKIIGVQQGTPEAKWLKDEAAKNKWNYKLRYYNSSPLAVEDILNGRIAAAAMNDAPANDAASKKDVQVLGQFGMHGEAFGYAVRKDDTKLLAKVNAGLEKLMKSPKWNELVVKYGLNK